MHQRLRFSMIFRCNVSPSNNLDIKTPLVGSFSLVVVIHFSPLAAFWCQGSSNDSSYLNLSYKPITNWKFVSKEQKSVWSKSLRRKQITLNAGRMKLVELILIGNEIASILGNCPTIFAANIENKNEVIYCYVIISIFHGFKPDI